MQNTNNLYKDAAKLVRDAGGVLFPSFYGAQLNPAATDQITIDVTPAPDRGPFVITSISGTPFTTIGSIGPNFRIDRISMRAGGNELQYEPFLAPSFAPIGIDFGTVLPYPILIPPGGSFYMRNFVTGDVGVPVNSPQIILQGFHTDARGARAIARNGQPWIVPYVNNHADTGQQDIQTERQMIANTVEMGYFTTCYKDISAFPAAAPNLLLNCRIRGVEIVQGASDFGQTVAVPPLSGFLESVGTNLLAKCQPGDSFTLRTVSNALPNPDAAFMGNLWTRRIYRQPNAQCN